MLHNSKVYLPSNLITKHQVLYAVTKVTEDFHLYNEHIWLKIFYVYFFLSIWTPCLVPLFIMLPAEY